MSFRTYFVGLTLVAASGCVANDRSLTITNFVAPVTMNGACSADPTGDVVTRGIWDVGLAAKLGVGYDTFFGVQNNLELMTGDTIDTSAFYINGFDVQIEAVGPVAAAIPAAREQFNYPAGSVRLAPGALISEHVEAVPPDLGAMIASTVTDSPMGTIVAHMRPVATRAEEEVVGAYVQYPIEVCNGCLSNANNGNFPQCPLPADAMVADGNACNYSNDEAVTCCIEGAKLFCGTLAPILTTM